MDNLIKRFNSDHPNIEVQAQFTGSYAETMTKAISATRAGNPPHIFQAYEVGTQTLLDSRAFVPVFELAKPGDIDWGDVIIPIRNYYSVKGKLYSMPFNSSTAILYYNKDLFKNAGLDPNHPPTSYKEMSEMGRKIIESEVTPNVLSFGWPAWVFEQMHALHNQFYTNNSNGRDGRATEVLFNRTFGVKVLEQWVQWARNKIFIYGGREYSANKAFLSGQIAMLIQSTSSVASIEKAAKFEVGTSFLPRLEGYDRGNSVIGGATIWVMKGSSEKELKAIWQFLRWLIQPEVAKQWHQETGYFPLTISAVKKLLDEGWFSKHPNHLTAFLQILSGNNTPQSQGVLLGNFVQIRDIVDSALEKAFQGARTPKEALDQAAKEANRILKEYNQLYQ
ncbi:MAG: ABC transporter substrate-binding protein [bacterium]